VLDHVHEQQFLAGAAERGQGDADHDESAVEARLAPARHRASIDRQRVGAPRVEQAEDHQRSELRRGEQPLGHGEWRCEEHHVSLCEW
jgi:hypothetical protein